MRDNTVEYRVVSLSISSLNKSFLAAIQNVNCGRQFRKSSREGMSYKLYISIYVNSEGLGDSRCLLACSRKESWPAGRPVSVLFQILDSGSSSMMSLNFDVH